MANIINGTDTGSGGLITTGDSSDELQLQTAETARVTLTNTAVVVNEDGNDVDFRVEGDTDANLLFVDASADKVGIGTSSPSTKLETYSAVDVNADNVNTNVLTLTAIDNTGGYYYANQGTGVAFRSGIVAGTTLGPEIMGAVYGANSAPQSVDNGQLTFHTRTSGSVTEKMRVTSDGYLRMASGTGGIQFNGDTAAANALDDYEEGTFTPQGNGITFSSASGSYTKIGRVVTVIGVAVWPSTASADFAMIANLPFTVSSQGTGHIGLNNIGGTEMYYLAFSGSSGLRLYNGSIANIVNSSLSTKTLYFEATYFVA